MAVEPFPFKAAEVPKAVRGARESKYMATVRVIDQYMKDHKNERSVKVDLGDVSIKSAVGNFRSAVAREFPNKLRVVQRGGELYIERRS